MSATVTRRGVVRLFRNAGSWIRTRRIRLAARAVAALRQHPAVRAAWGTRLGYAAKLCVATVLLLQAVVVFVTSYDLADCDDKAVHYYCAAQFAAADQARGHVARRFADWDRYDRVCDRLRSAPNYGVANALISWLRHRTVQRGPDDYRATVFSHYVKNACLAMLLFSLAFATIVGARTPFGVLAMGVTVCLVAFNMAKLEFLAGVPRYNMHPFMAYSPRGSASVFVPALLLAYAARRRILFALTCALLIGWHAGLGTIVLAVAGIVIAASESIGGMHRKSRMSVRQRARLHTALFFVIVPVLLCGCAYLLIRSVVTAVPVSRPGDAVLEVAFVRQRLLAVVVLVGLVVLCMRTGIVRRENGFERRCVFGLSGFILFSHLSRLAAAVCPVAQNAIARMAVSCDAHSIWKTVLLKATTPLPFLDEIPTRLTGPDFIVCATLLVFVVQCTARRLDCRSGTKGGPRVASGVASLVVLVLIAQEAHRNGRMYDAVFQKRARFFQEDCAAVNEKPLTEATLRHFEPGPGIQGEAAFFYSIAEYLFASSSPVGEDERGPISGEDEPARERSMNAKGTYREREPERLRQGLERNGSFEEVVNGLPAHWKTAKWQDAGAYSDMGVTDAHSVHGRHSVYILNRGRCDARVVQRVRVQPDTRYELSGWIKTVGVESERGGAYLEVGGLHVCSTRLSGSEDWTFVTVKFTTRDRSEITLCCRLGANGKTTSGEALFDSLMLSESR